MAAKRKTTTTKKRKASSPKKRKPTVATVNYALDATIDIRNIDNFYCDLRDLLNKAKKVKMDTGKLKWIDTSGMQLLCCWYLEAKEKGIDVTWKNIEGTFTNSAAMLGLTNSLNLNQ